MPSPRDLDPKFKTVDAPETPEENTADKPDPNPTKEAATPAGGPVPGGAVTPLDTTVDPDDETFIVYRHPDGDVRMPTSEWADYQKENGL